MRKIVFLILIIAVVFLAGCKSESYIKKEIEKAGYCTIDSDCALVESRCPFGCYAAVNVNEKERITKLIDSYNPKFEKCVYGCVLCTNVTCVENRCKEVCK